MNSQQKEGQDNKWISGLSIFLAVSLALNIILYFKGEALYPKRKELAKEKSELVRQVQQYKNDINRYSGISANIDKVIADANLKLEAKEKQILALKMELRAKDLDKHVLSNQLDSLQENYLTVIDSLLVERETKKVINTKIQDLEDEITRLNTRIDFAGMLLGDNLSVTPVKRSKSGKITPSAMSKKTSEIKICLDILENKISKPGNRNVYFVITSPNAELVSDQQAGAASEFFHPEYKTNALCSKVEKIDYQNQKISTCSSIIPDKTMVNGLYLVEVFSDDLKLGMTTFALR